MFGGSGSVLLGKQPSKFEVYNDIDGELVNLFRVAKNRIAELLLELDLLPLNSREEFDAWLHFHEGAGDPTPYLPAQLEIVDCLVPQEWATRLKEKLCQSFRFILIHLATEGINFKKHMLFFPIIHN